MLLAYVEFYIFVNRPGARLAYTLMCDCCFTVIDHFVLVMIQSLTAKYSVELSPACETSQALLVGVGCFYSVHL